MLCNVNYDCNKKLNILSLGNLKLNNKNKFKFCAFESSSMSNKPEIFSDGKTISVRNMVSIRKNAKTRYLGLIFLWDATSKKLSVSQAVDVRNYEEQITISFPDFTRDNITIKTGVVSVIDLSEKTLPEDNTLQQDINLDIEFCNFEVLPLFAVNLEEMSKRYKSFLDPELLSSEEPPQKDFSENRWKDIFQLMVGTKDSVEETKENKQLLAQIRQISVENKLNIYETVCNLREVIKYQLPECAEDFGQDFDNKFKTAHDKLVSELEQFGDSEGETLLEHIKFLEIKKNIVMELQIYCHRVDNLQRNDPPQARRCNELAFASSQAAEVCSKKVEGTCLLISEMFAHCDEAFLQRQIAIGSKESSCDMTNFMKSMRLFNSCIDILEEIKHHENQMCTVHILARRFYLDAVERVFHYTRMYREKWAAIDDARMAEHTSKTDEIHREIEKDEKFYREEAEETLKELFAQEQEMTDLVYNMNRSSDEDEYMDFLEKELVHTRKIHSEYVDGVQQLVSFREEINKQATTTAIQRQVAESVRIERRLRKEDAIRNRPESLDVTHSRARY